MLVFTQRDKIWTGINKEMICRWKDRDCCCGLEREMIWARLPFKIVLFSGDSSFALSSHRSPSYRSAHQLPNRQVVLKAERGDLRWVRGKQSRILKWTIKAVVLRRRTTKDSLRVTQASLGGGKGRLLSRVRHNPDRPGPVNVYPGPVLFWGKSLSKNKE